MIDDHIKRLESEATKARGVPRPRDSNPCYLYVGERSYDYSVIPKLRWKKQYEDAGISYHIIAKIKQLLGARGVEDVDD